MRDNNYRHRNNEGSTFFAFITGLVIGGIAAFMANPDNRQKVQETFGDAKKKGRKLIAETTKKLEEGVDTMSEKAKELADSAEEAAKKLKKS